MLLSANESQRLSAIIVDTIDKIRCIDLLAPDTAKHHEGLSKFVGEETSRSIKEQRHNEQQYATLNFRRALWKSSANKQHMKEVAAEIRRVSQSLRESTKILCSNLQDNSNVSGNLPKIQEERTKTLVLLRHTLLEVSFLSTSF